jgi:saccharopine dehydrogenase-like NADP-dependent oxidoreductase
MSAMKMIDGVHAAGGKVRSFVSSCGGLPAPAAADNPLGYKFSWNPRGAILAGRNAATYKRGGKVVQVEGEGRPECSRCPPCVVMNGSDTVQ